MGIYVNDVAEGSSSGKRLVKERDIRSNRADLRKSFVFSKQVSFKIVV